MTLTEEQKAEAKKCEEDIMHFYNTYWVPNHGELPSLTTDHYLPLEEYEKLRKRRSDLIILKARTRSYIGLGFMKPFINDTIKEDKEPYINHQRIANNYKRKLSYINKQANDPR